MGADALRRFNPLRSGLHGAQGSGSPSEAGDGVCIVPQNLYESWSLATRPIASNGLAVTAEQANRVLTRIEQILVIVRDAPAIYDEWRRLVCSDATSGKAAHDARLVAAMDVHGIDYMLTFNTDDFKRYTGTTVLNPGDVEDQPVEPARES